MIKNKFLTSLLILLISFGLTACTNNIKQESVNGSNTSSLSYETSEEKDFTSAYENKIIAVQAGSVFDTMVSQYIPKAKIEYYNTNADMALALNIGKISAYVADEPVARLLCDLYSNQYIDGAFEKCPYAYVYPKTNNSTIIRTKMNEYLAKIKADGTLKQIDDIWFGDDESLKVVDTSNMVATNGTLEFAIITAVGAPFAYIKDNNYVGYDVDIAVRFCREYGYAINITDYGIGGFFSSISTGLVDFGASSICITEERKETMDFSDSNYEGSIVLVTSNQTATLEKESFLTSISNSFQKTFIREDRWKMFANGFGVTVFITLFSILLGTAFGFAFFLLYRKKFKFINNILDGISVFLQMTPIVVVLMIFFYLIFAKAGFSGTAVSIISFSLMFACTILDCFKSSAKTIGEEQYITVKALGYKDTYGFLRIILPQLLPNFLHQYKGAVVGLIKSTSIVSYVAVQDLTMISDIVRSRTYDAFFPLVVTAIIYFLFALLLTSLVNKIEIKLDIENRSTKKIFKGVKTK